MNFINNWPKYAKNIEDICEIDGRGITSGWANEIENLLLQLSLFPTKVKRKRARLHSEQILEVGDKLIVFCNGNNSTMILFKSENCIQITHFFRSEHHQVIWCRKNRIIRTLLLWVRQKRRSCHTA